MPEKSRVVETNERTSSSSLPTPVVGPPQPRFRKTRPPVLEAFGAAAGFVAAFLVPPPATPLRIAPIVVFFVVAAGFLTTVPVLPSLVSLVPLARWPARVTGLFAGGGAFEVVVVAGRRPLAAAVGPLQLELASEAAVTLRVAPWRVAFAFSTMLERTLVMAADRLSPCDFNGDPGRAMCDLVGDAGRSRVASREFDEVGERTWMGRVDAASATWCPRAFRSPLKFSISFSLSPATSPLSRGVSTHAGRRSERLDSYRAGRWARSGACGREVPQAALCGAKRGASLAPNSDGRPSTRFRSCSRHLCIRSPILTLRRDVGIRLTRISIRDRRPWAWRWYCARNLRARSVTAMGGQHYALARVGPRARPTLQLQVIYQSLLLQETDDSPGFSDGISAA